MNKKSNLMFIISQVCLDGGLIGFLITIILENRISAQASKILYIVSVLLEIIGLLLVILRSVFFGFKPIDHSQRASSQPQKVKTVDVKPIDETKEEKLFKQYEELYKEGFISKEELEKKRIDLFDK